jgi:hypothetical protein
VFSTIRDPATSKRGGNEMTAYTSNMRWAFRLAFVFLFWAVVSVPGLALGPQNQPPEATRIDLQISSQMEGQPTPRIVGTQTYWLSDTGKYRVEETREGRTAVEIVDSIKGTRTSLDFGRKEAVVRSLATKLPADASPSPSSVRSDQNTKNVGGLTLYGTAMSSVGPSSQGNAITSSELWAYHFPDLRIPPLIVEVRIAGHGEILDKRIVNVTKVTGTEPFEIPENFSIVTR